MVQHSSSLSRRQFSRLLAGGSLALVAGGLATATPAAAGRAWCKKDPEFLINGRRLHVYLAGPAELDAVVTGPSDVILYIPKQGVQAEFIWADEGFGGLGYNIAIVRSASLAIDPISDAIPVEVEAFVHTKGIYAVEVELVHEHHDGHKPVNRIHKGKTNQKVRTKGKL